MKSVKSILALLLVCTLLLPYSTCFAADSTKAETITFTITVGEPFTGTDGASLGAAFVGSGGRMMAPLRAMADQMKLTVTWDNETRTAVFTGIAVGQSTEQTVRFPIGSTNYTVTTSTGETAHTIDTAAVISGGRTYAPVRYLAEAFGFQVAWNSATKTATVSTEEIKVPTDPTGTVSFENLRDRVCNGYPTAKALEETIAGIQRIEYDTMSDDMRDALNQMADAIFMLYVYGGDNYTISSLQQQYDALRDSFDDLKDGTLQQDNADLIRNLQNTVNQIVMGSETLYIAILSMEQSYQDLQNSAASLDRTVKEMETRYQLGQISALQLAQVKSGRTTLQSNMQTLRVNISNSKAQLQSFLGESPTETLTLSALPAVTDADLASMDYEKDLAAAKAASWTLRDADITLKDAKETWDDAQSDYGYGQIPGKRYQYDIAQHTWQSAQYTHDGTYQSFELNFRTLYNLVPNYRQLLSAAQQTLAYQEQNYAAAQLQYQLGTISFNALMDAANDRDEAASAVTTAKSDLFTAYNNYRWAVEYGLLN